MSVRSHARAALVVLTGLNILNYIDRSVLFAVQPLVQQEFHRSDAQFGFLTTAFFLCYMVAAPITGWFADRHPRKYIIVGGAIVWSLATLLTAITYDFRALLLRHILVGIGEATFVTITPSFLADLFDEEQRGRIFAFFYLATPVGTALGYVIGGQLGPHYGWRTPFYVAGVPGFLLGLCMLAIPEPERGKHDSISETAERGTIVGLFHNWAFWTATLGMAFVTFALGGLLVWMPTFLSRVRGYRLEHANQIFGLSVLFNGVVATLIGGWLADRLLRRLAGAYYLTSAIGLALALPVMVLALRTTGPILLPAIVASGFLLLLNTGPLNAAVITSVGAHIRSTAVSINIIVIHLLGDAFSPTLIGYISDRSSLQTGMMSMTIAILLASAVLFYGIQFAPNLHVAENSGPSQPAVHG